MTKKTVIVFPRGSLGTCSTHPGALPAERGVSYEQRL